MNGRWRGVLSASEPTNWSFADVNQTVDPRLAVSAGAVVPMPMVDVAADA